MSNKYPGGIITSGANAGYSVAFDGTGDYLSISSAAALQFGAGDFTIEAWVYPTSFSSSFSIASKYTSGNVGASEYLFLVTTAGKLGIALDGGGGEDYFESSAGAVSLNTWAHCAVSKSGTTVRLFVNGVQVQSGTSSRTLNSTSTALSIGVSGTAGYAANARIVKGTALYTAAFTPPTQLFNITNTSLLTCNSPAIVDQSSNNFTITANGNAAVSTFTPFQGYVAYNPALGAATPGIWTVSDAIQAAQTRRWNMYDPYFNLTTLLLHGNYTGSVNSSGTAVYQNNNFLDSSSNNFTITRNGNPTQGTFSPFSQTGWSSYIDSNTSYVSFGSSADFTFGTGDFTVEAWVYVAAIATSPSNQPFGVFNVGGASTGSYNLAINPNGTLQSTRYGDSAGAGTTAATIQFNTWNHVAAVRSGSTARIFINGVADSTSAYSMGNVTATAGESGRIWQTAYNSQCYVSNLRVCKGTAVYTGNFTPSTTPLTSTSQSASNCVLLIFQSNRFVDTNTATTAKTITVNGTPSVQAFSPFYPVVAYTPQAQGGSGYFDGTGDYLSIANNTAFDFGSGDFTIEMWWYPTAISGNQNLVAKWWTGGTQWVLQWRGSTANQFKFSWNNTSSTSFTSVLPQLNAWNHIAVVRSGTSLYLYQNGTRNATVGTISGSLTATTDPFTVGQFGNSSTEYLNGYLTDVRITKGGALYTASTITVPTSPLTTSVSSGTVSALLSYTNAGITDATAKNVFETVGNAQISTTQSKFGGSSMYFDGSGDYLQAPNSSLANFGGGDFTIEFWMYASSQALAPIVHQTSYSSNQGWIVWNYNGSNTATSTRKLTFMMNGATFTLTTSSDAYADNTWTHIAVVKSGTGANNIKIYSNGTVAATGTYATAAANTANPLMVGGIINGTSWNSTNYFNGYIDDLRITQGYARYTGNFTPQTSQWQDQ